MSVRRESLETEDTRTRLREAALSLFGRQGVQGTSTREILEAAGLRNPSAINYYFGSKAELVDDLVEELITEAWPLLQLQVDAAATSTPTVREWVEVAVDSAVEILGTERGCLLACLWWEWECFLHPDAVEEFIGSDLPLAVEWREAALRVLPDLPPLLTLARNLLVIRTVEWVTARRARRYLMGLPTRGVRAISIGSFRAALLDQTYAMLTCPSSVAEADLTID